LKWEERPLITVSGSSSMRTVSRSRTKTCSSQCSSDCGFLGDAAVRSGVDEAHGFGVVALFIVVTVKAKSYEDIMTFKV
jgi:hypothetical protein